MKTFSKKLLALIVGIIIVSIGASFTIKANIGIGAYDAVALTISFISKIRVGTISIFVNTLCILGQLILEKKNFKPIQFLQFGLVLLQGTMINFLVYQVFGGFEITYYILSILCLVAGYFMIAFGVALIIESDIIRNPLEGLCQIISDRIGKPMGKFRQKWDIAFILLSIALTFIFSTEFSIREGTVIGMIIFGPAMDLFRRPITKQFKRWNMSGSLSGN